MAFISEEPVSLDSYLEQNNTSKLLISIITKNWSPNEECTVNFLAIDLIGTLEMSFC